MASEALYAVPHKQLELGYAWLLQNPNVIDSFHTFLLHSGIETPKMLTACALFARICSIDLRTLIRGRPASQTHREQDRPYCTLAEKGHVFDAVYNTLLQMLKVRAWSSCSAAHNAPYMLTQSKSEAARLLSCQSGRQLQSDSILFVTYNRA